MSKQESSSPAESAGEGTRERREKLIRFGAFILCLAVFMGYMIFRNSRASLRAAREDAPAESAGDPAGPTAADLFGEIVYLDAGSGGAFRLSPDGEESYDKKLLWDGEEECYFDPASDCWLRYDAEAASPQWEYWVQDVSPDFGDYGWMKYEPGGWVVQQAEGNWIPLPDRYDQSELWHIDASLD